MTQHNSDDEHHPLEPFYNAKDHVEQIVKLPEFEKLHEAFRDEPGLFFGDQSGMKRSRRIYRFMELAYPYMRSDEDAEAIAEEQDTSARLRKFLHSLSDNGSAVIIKPNVGGSVVKTATESPNTTMKESALKKTIRQLEDRIIQIRRQLGEQ